MDDNKIEEAATSGDRTKKSYTNPDKKPVHVYRSRPWSAAIVTIGVATIAGGGFWWLIWASRAFDKVTEARTFITGGAFTLALLIVAIVQACVYWSQRNKMQESLELTDRIIDKMQDQLNEMVEQSRTNNLLHMMQRDVTNPRLRIEHVRALDFDAGKQPTYAVSIVNDGLIPARDVVFEMKVCMGNKEERSGDKFDVPAHETETAFLVSHGVLDEEQIESFNSGIPLIISGHLSYFPYQQKEGDPAQEFCYKYLPWKGERPEGISQFVRCTRKAGSDITLHAGTGHFKLTGYPATMTHSRDITNVAIHENAPNEAEVSVEKKEESAEKSDKAI